MYKRIIRLLDSHNISYDEINHEVSTSCDHSKQLRIDAWLEWLWSKNIVFHSEWRFYIVVTHGDKRINAKRFKKEFWSKNIRFATADEIKGVINWTIWCIPSFGYPNEEIPMYVDSEIFSAEYFMFNPGEPEKTIRVQTWDLNYLYTKLKNPVKFFIGWVETMDIIEE